ncbi:MAG: flagellar basal body L-ring protein FlgH [Balneolales bacterium]
MAKNFIKGKLIILFVILLWANVSFAQQSLYSDVKAHRPGDVITVIMTENIRGTSRSDSRTQSNTDGSASSGISGSMLPIEATFGADASMDYNSDERGQASQSQLLSGTLSVRIEEVDEGGNYFITGNRRTEVSGEIYKMDISGYIRPEDINDANEVLSFRIANAEIVYQSEGGIAEESRKRGFKRRILWGIMGIGTGVAAILTINR